MKQKNYRFTDEDIQIIEELRHSMGISNDIDVIRIAIRHTKKSNILNGQNSDYVPSFPYTTTVPLSNTNLTFAKNTAEASPIPVVSNPARKSKFSPSEIDMYVNYDGLGFMFCPLHKTGYLRGCGCLNDRSLFEKRLKETYE